MGETTITDTRGGPPPAVASGGDQGTATAGTVAPAGSRGRRIAFRTLAILLALWVVLLNVFGLTELVLMWLPVEAVGAIVDEAGGPDLVVHRTHFMAVGILSWAVVLPTLVQLRRPERRVGSMRFLVVVALASLVAFGLSGTFGEWLLEEWSWVLPVLVLAILHPRARTVLRMPSHDRSQLVLAGLAALPWAWYVLANARLQLANGAVDEHAAMEHWAIAALLGVIVVAGAVVGAGRTDGWRLPAWIAACASILFGVHSLVFPGLASGLGAAWAVSAVLWGVAFAGAIVARGRVTRPEVTDAVTSFASGA